MIQKYIYRLSSKRESSKLSNHEWKCGSTSLYIQGKWRVLEMGWIFLQPGGWTTQEPIGPLYLQQIEEASRGFITFFVDYVFLFGYVSFLFIKTYPLNGYELIDDFVHVLKINIENLLPMFSLWLSLSIMSNHDLVKYLLFSMCYIN
jgi:hypothetical protein